MQMQRASTAEHALQPQNSFHPPNQKIGAEDFVGHQKIVRSRPIVTTGVGFSHLDTVEKQRLKRPSWSDPPINIIWQPVSRMLE